ncbi:transglutaminase-like domain-containing protein [Dissulfurispira sp.]|uniref:transglutaminase-like domain-containing protein n=1 Tax=Dissulfurispira sp. TaxID=2817609 RepID=UPI002FDB3EBF
MRRLKAVSLIVSLISILLFVNPSFAKERHGEVTVQVNLNAPADAKNVRLWIPYPVSDEHQNIEDIRVNGNFSQGGVYREGENGSMALYAEWEGAMRERTLTYTFKVKRKEVIKKDFPKKEPPFSKEEFSQYLKATSLGPTTGKVKELAEKITKDKKTNLAKARAIYDWIVDNMHRDPNVKGCGFGVVETLLETKGGKCADIHSVFVALSRAAGIPAREVFGIRIPKGKEGDMTKAQHCWAEFYLPGYGWVVVDPSDVRKAILEQKLTIEQAKPLREYYFGAVDESRIAFGTGRDIILNPQQNGRPLNYFMYPYAEADGKPLNEDLFGFNIGYRISFKEQ